MNSIIAQITTYKYNVVKIYLIQHGIELPERILLKL